MTDGQLEFGVTWLLQGIIDRKGTGTAMGVLDTAGVICYYKK